MKKDQEERLLEALAERPVNQGNLWAACWGDIEQEGEKIPANIDRIAQDILKAKQSRVVLVHGRYGTGKSSFMHGIRTQIESKVIDLWLDMPSLTSHINSSALAAVMIQMGEKLSSETENSGSEECNFGRALEDLWCIEAREIDRSCDSSHAGIAEPEPNRMAGTLYGDGSRTVKANTVEKKIGECINSLKKKQMVVFLDDLDRCEHIVAMDVVRLLLRFGPIKNVHFVLACDWDVLEQGVKDWMENHGKSSDGTPIVTANSALEKYIHISVELPGMGAIAMNLEKNPDTHQAEISMNGALKIQEAKDDEYRQAQLFDVLINDLLNSAYTENQS